ncbi:MAG: hypothetical protein A2Y33_05180 [Spirochaetes bacterium GWF1_51_8]|nr:MAG: hypothetical protein A2Y33_05180 [Spirochaetes bacterium GWF1_51_8]
MQKTILALIALFTLTACTIPVEQFSMELQSLYMLRKELYDHYRAKIQEAMLRYADPQVRNKEVARLDNELLSRMIKIESEIASMTTKGESDYGKETMNGILAEMKEIIEESDFAKKLYENTHSRGMSFIEV